MNRKVEVFIGIAIVLSLAIFIGVNIFNTLFDSESTIDKIGQAIESNDIGYLKDRVEIEGIKDELTREELENIVDVLKDNILVGSLKDYYEDKDKNIYLKKEGKEKLIFDKYILVLKPYKLTVSTNIPGSKIYIDGKEMGKISNDSSDIVFSSILPGTHKIRLLYEGEYSSIEGENEIICFNTNSDEIYTDLYLEGEYIDIDSNRKEAYLYINGKDTGINLARTYTLGPIPTDGSINIAAKAKIEGDIYESDTVSIDEYIASHELYIDYVEPAEEPIDEAVFYESDEKDNDIDKINNLMNNYQYGMVAAINNGDYSYVNSFIESGSPLETAQIKLVDNLSSKGTSEEFLNYTIHSINKISDNIFEAQVSESHNIFYSSGESKAVSNTWIYTVVKYGDSLYLRDLRK